MDQKKINGITLAAACAQNRVSESACRYSVAVSSVKPLLDYLQRRGMTQEQLRAQHEALMSCLGVPDARLAVLDYHALWHSAISFTQNESLGLSLAQAQDCLDMGIVGHVVFNSDTMRQGLENYIRLFRIVNDSLLLDLEEDALHGHLVFRHQSPELYCIPDIERCFVLAATRSQYWLGVSQAFTGVYFQHKPPVYAAQYRKVFNCPVYFNQPDCKIVFDRAALDLPPKHHNPSLKEATLQYANRLLDELRQMKLSDQIRRLLERDLSNHEPDIQSIARQLNMSKQTLYKKLKLEGQVFQKLLESVRLTKACQLLSHSAISTTEIAYLLGFSELSAFSRAFKRWTGMSPRAYRSSGVFPTVKSISYQA